MWSDNESNVDYLNYSETADVVIGILSRPDLRPISVGVFGGWGVGKSSMVKLIEEKLKRDDQFLLISFDAWLFQGYDDARSALLNTIGTKLLEAAKEKESLHEKAIGLLQRVDKLRSLGLLAELGAAALGMPAFGAISSGSAALSKMFGGESQDVDLEAIKTAGKDVTNRGKGLLKEAQTLSPPEEVRAFRKEFRELLKGLEKTLVVVVDNLDRCLPKDSIQTLEAIRLFLFVPQTAFVIAADEEMIRHAVTEYYGARQTRLVTDYLDKFVQVPVRVPRAGFAEIRAYLIMLLSTVPLDTETMLSKGQLNAMHAHLIKHLRSIWRSQELTAEELIQVAHAAETVEPKQRTIIANAFRLSDLLAPQLATASRVSGNPRIVKRMLNTIRMRSEIARARKMPLDEATIAKLVLFERCASSAATNALLDMIAAAKGGQVKEIKSLEGEHPELPKAWEADADFIREWASLLPKLGTTDLRPAAYLARDTAPLKFSTTDLSVQAEQTLKVLVVATSKASPNVKAHIEKLLPDERLPVLEQIIKQLALISDWNKQPAGFAGAMSLADKSSDCAIALADFIRAHIPNRPKWLSFALNNSEWWKEAE